MCESSFKRAKKNFARPLVICSCCSRSPSSPTPPAAQEALKGVNPFGFRRLLSNAAGEFAGNLAAFASSDEELARTIGETLCSAFAGSELECNGDANMASKCHASVVFVRGSLCVLRVRVSCSSEGVASLLALTAGPTAADWWRFGVHELLPSVVVIGPACARLVDAAARTGIATLLCRQCTSAVPVALTESLKSEVGLQIVATPTPPCAEADELFALIGRCDSARAHIPANGVNGHANYGHRIVHECYSDGLGNNSNGHSNGHGVSTTTNGHGNGLHHCVNGAANGHYDQHRGATDSRRCSS